MPTHQSLISVFCAAALLAGAPANADGHSVDHVVEVSLIEGWRMSEGRHMAGIRIALAQGWKTYWRAPGEGGVPTVLQLTRADGITGMVIHWPRPHVHITNGMRSIGYSGHVVLPVEFAVEEAGGSHLVMGRLDLGVCLDVCIPVTVDVSGELFPDATRDAEIGLALSDRPLTASEAGAGDVQCDVVPISDGLRVTVTAQVQDTGAQETMVVEHSDPHIWVSESQTRRDGGTVTAIADIVPPDHGPFALNRSDLRMTVIGGRMAVELDGCRG